MNKISKTSRRRVLLGVGGAAALSVPAAVLVSSQSRTSLKSDAESGANVLTTGQWSQPAPGSSVPAEQNVAQPSSSARPPETDPEHGDKAPSGKTLEEIRAAYAGRIPEYWGEHAPAAIRDFSPSPGAREVVLTFDACGGQVFKYDEELIGTLREFRVKATLFINRNWAAANPTLLKELNADPLFEIANHGDRHVPLSVTGRSAWGIKGTSSIDEVWAEVVGSHASLAAHGIETSFMRPGTAYTDEVSAEIARDAGQRVVSFSLNGDGGAKFPAWLVAQIVSAAKPGDIVISHFNQPGSGTALGYRQALASLKKQGTTFLTLSEALSGD